MDDLIEQQRKLPFIKEIILDDNTALVKLKGAVDSSTIPLMKKDRRKNFTGQRHIILDFKEVEHIDSSTLGQLVMVFLELKANNKRLAVINVTAPLQNYIDLLKLNSIVKTYTSKKAALAALP